jgi:sugar phosphate isomerase/epimerase
MWSIGFEGAMPARPMSAWDLLEKAGELGVGVVQYGPNLPLDWLPPREFDRLIRQAAEWGIEVEVGTKGLDADALRGQIALARRASVRLLRTVTEYGDGAASIADAVAPVVPDLERAGVRLAIENARVPARVLRAAVESLGTPWVGVTLDTVNSLAIPEGTAEVAEVLAPHTFCLHVKDFVVERIWHRMGFTVEGRAAGKGQLDVPRLLSVLSAAGADPNAILELWTPEQERLDGTIALEQAWAVESIAYLRTLIPD